MDQINLCGVRIDNITKREAVAFALRKRNFPCMTVTPNAVMLDTCRRDARCSELLNAATLSLADGMGVMLLARRQGTPFVEKVSGIEFGEALMERAAEQGLRVFLLGGKEGVAHRAADNLCLRYPKLQICGAHNGYFDKNGEENEALLSSLSALRPDILLVCFGFPAQELWMRDNLPHLPFLRVAAGLGGSLDVWAGDVARAPALLSRIGLEWAWRMAREPRRLSNLPALLRIAFWRG